MQPHSKASPLRLRSQVLYHQWRTACKGSTPFRIDLSSPFRVSCITIVKQTRLLQGSPLCPEAQYGSLQILFPLIRIFEQLPWFRSEQKKTVGCNFLEI